MKNIIVVDTIFVHIGFREIDQIWGVNRLSVLQVTKYCFLQSNQSFW